MPISHELIEHSMESVAVIGAGLAGLSAARSLQIKGHHVQIFEKGDEIGGRLNTHREPWGDFDQGAQYFTARHPDFVEQVHVWQHMGIAQCWDMQPATWRNGELLPSPDQQQRWVGTPGMHSLAVNLARDLNILCNARIINIEYERDQWWLYDMKGRHFGPFEALILAAPIQDVVSLLPETSSILSSIRQVKMLPCWSLACTFKESFAPDWLQGIFCEHPILRWVSRDNRKPGRSNQQELWVLHSQERWTQLHMHIGKHQLVDYMMRALKDILGQELPTPHNIHTHLWHQARSQLTPNSVQKKYSVHTLLDKQTRLAVCGDWLTGGRVEGAFISGLKTAEAMTSVEQKAQPEAISKFI